MVRTPIYKPCELLYDAKEKRVLVYVGAEEMPSFLSLICYCARTFRDQHTEVTACL